MNDIYQSPAVKLPTAAVTVIAPKGDDPGIAHSLDAQGLHAILRDAEAGNCSRLWTLYRDIVQGDSGIQSELAKRKLALLGDPISVQPWNADDPADVAAAELVEREIVAHPDFFGLCVHLLDAVLWPISVAERVYAPGRGMGEPRYRIARLIPVPARLIDYRQGEPRILIADPVTGRPGPESVPLDPGRFIVHRGHLLTAPDRFGGPMRSIVWWWFFGALNRAWWARHVERYGSPFLIGHYAPGDDAARLTLESAFAYATRLGGLVVTENTKVEIKEALRGDGAAFEKFHTLCRREISKLILGQTLSAEAQPTGLNSGMAKTHEAVRRDIRQFDGAALARTLRDQLIAPWLAANGIRANAPTIVWSEDAGESAIATGELLAKLKQAGLEPADDAIYTISERVGFPLRRAMAAPPVPEPFDAAAGEVGGRAFFRRERGAGRITGV